MTLDLNAIPYADEAPPGAARTTVLSAVSAPRRRRAFLRAVGYAGLSVGAAVLALPFAARTARAEWSPGGTLRGWDANNCTDAYPSGYSERRDTHGNYVGETAACFGGTYMGWNWCTSSGWHRSGQAPSSPPGWTWEMWPISSACGRAPTRNAWRWTTQPGSKVWRCSDGNSKVRRNVWLARWQGPYLSICRARV
jgi:hypothetical protein